ncbi:S-adenosylmethionine:tRNA ribosyltransferase-isomerase [uncultured Sphaerochaeta sp.]|nr:S-adenosylmethionine:tRNA ribosyltransferase-isomerase [uncultured Sphaerochaeta sp.]
MKIKEFSFDLPPELIAQTPSGTRGNDRLLVLDRISGYLY